MSEEKALQNRNEANEERVGVIIAAKDASGTIARAVRSALAQNEVGEVIVVDDGSSDATAELAERADDGSGRLDVIRLEANAGPAAARNLAIERGSAPLLAVLDADDMLLEGRFARLLDGRRNWDAIADNVVFVREQEAHAMDLPRAFTWSKGNRFLTPEQFIAGNIARHGKPRGELGFLKPLMSRDFLVRHGLRYNESLRLGEDFDLYARMLLSGARFKLSGICGYVAAERPDSLSAMHRPEDLEALMRADDALLLRHSDPAAKAALARHRAHVAARWHHRALLDSRRDVGIIGALSSAALRPRLLVDGIAGVLRDKVAKYRPRSASGEIAGPRFLISDGTEAERAILDRLSRPAGRI